MGEGRGGHGAETLPYAQVAVRDVMEELGTSEHGLTDEEASYRLERWGPNRLARRRTSRVFEIIVDQFKDPLIYLLLAAAALTGFLRQFIDMWAILAAVTINAIIGFFQEYRADRSIEGLIRLTSPKAHVIREGRIQEVDSTCLVPGDVVVLTAGARVPADLRLIEANRLELEEAALTGESLGVAKHTDAVDAAQATAVGQRNMAYMGTTVLTGLGKGIVVATGARTELGRISEAVRSVDEALTPLQIQLARLGRTIGIGVGILAAITIVLSAVAGISLREGVLTAIALTVAAVPEGLPIVVTVTLAVGARRMARRNAIVRRLPAVETLGSCSVILSDKTGTLTKNEMTVREIHTARGRYVVSGTGYTPEGQIRPRGMPSFAFEAAVLPAPPDTTPPEKPGVDGVGVNGIPVPDGEVDEVVLGKPGLDEPETEPAVARDPALAWTLRVGLVANASKLSYGPDEGFQPHGDPTEAALIVAARKGGMHVDEEDAFERLDEIPFESDRAYMATLARHRRTGDTFIMVKGAVERLLDMAGVTLDASGSRAPLTSETRRRLMDAAADMARRGLRVLAMAYRPVESTVETLSENDLRDLIISGLQGMIDPPRPEAKEAIRGAQQAGIHVKMVTGDHPDTAEAVARELGIQKPGQETVTGPDLGAMDDETLGEKLRDVSVFARVSPLDKLRLVRQFVARNHVVAVTGDGVNDAPALKASHIGVAMGITGTDVAKESSDMVIADDNFASIFAAVQEGRVVFANIRKVIFFLLPTGLGIVLTIFYTLIAGLPLPFLPAQILWINLATNGLQDVALALEPKEPGLLRRPPRRPDTPIMGPVMLQRLVLVGLVLMAGTVYVFQRQLSLGLPMAEVQSAALTTSVLIQMFHAFNSRSERESVFRTPFLSNPALLGSLAIALTAHLFVIYHPSLQFVFRTGPLDLSTWLIMVPVAATIVLVVEVEKWYRRRIARW